MADTRTEHLNLIKQDPEAVPDYLDDHSNLEILDEEVWKRGKAFNGQPVGEDGGFHIRNIPYAENLETSSSQSSDADFIIRTTGGDASLMDGDAWLTLIKGTMTHTGYVPQSITMTVTPMARPTPPEITATLNNETFIAYVQQPGEYTISYTTSWSESPATYGITVTNDPVNGDSITVVWDGEDDPEMTVNAVPRQAPESIAAVIDDSVFVAYVQQSGTTTLTYGTAWSADPALYGITVTGTPIAGDVITVVYVKEVRGTIIQSTPETFVSTGWNLYNHTAGYARVIKYSTEYNFKISGAYTALEFASTPSGTRTTITPVSGAFSIPSDGYIIVTGGNATTTAIWMTWSDWVSGYNWDGSQQGDFAPYSETVVDFGTFMATNFPYGLMQVGTAQDEINFNIGVATSKVIRLAYNDTNLATAKESGRQYEYDENYIYLERETQVTYSVEVDGDYAAFDHGMEFFTGTAQAVYAQTLYGQNLKNKLERDVLTISQQTLTTAQKSQVRANIGLGGAATQGVANNLTTKASGSVLDARQGKVLNEKIQFKYKDLESIASLSALETALDTELTNAANLQKIQLRFVAGAAYGLFKNGETYFIDLSKSSGTTYAHATFTHGAGFLTISAYRSSTGWKYESINSDGIEIAENTDLNSLTTPGFYYSPNSTRSATLINAPYSAAGFSLIVMKQGGNTNQHVQISNRVYVRGTGSGGTTWDNWRRLATVDE